MTRIRVVVVDDHTIVRDGICALLRLSGDMEVAGEASNGRGAIEMVRKHMPDVILMDIAMPNLDGLEATRQIHREFPRVRILVLTQYEDKEHVFSAIEAGASGFLNKTAASSELISAIRSVYRGGSFLSPSAARFLVENYQTEVDGRKEQDPFRQLSDREREILKLLAEGFTTRKIANLLVISIKTVEGHKTNLMSKLDIHNRADLVKYALRKGIISV